MDQCGSVDVHWVEDEDEDKCSRHNLTVFHLPPPLRLLGTRHVDL